MDLVELRESMIKEAVEKYGTDIKPVCFRRDLTECIEYYDMPVCGKAFGHTETRAYLYFNHGETTRVVKRVVE